MATLSFSDLEGVWIAGGGSPSTAPLMAAIALAESGGNPQATNPTDNGGRQTSWGLWQISNGDHSEPASNWNDPVENARLAVGKIRSQGLGAWGTYTTGAYKQYLKQGVAPTTPAGSPPAAGGGDATTGGASTGSGAVSAGLSSTGPAGWLGSLLGTLASGGGDPLAGVFGTVLGPVANTFADFSHALSTFMTAVVWLVNPRNWVRMIAGGVGALSALTGVVLVARAA